MVAELLAQAEWRLADLDVIGFGQGPGAFTGVRVAVAVAQGLGFAANLPLVGVSTLAATAHGAAQQHGEGDWLIAFDARMNERSEEHTSELQSRPHLVCRLLL